MLMFVLMRLCLCLCASENSIRQISGFVLLMFLLMLTLMLRVFSLVMLMLCLCASENQPLILFPRCSCSMRFGVAMAHMSRAGRVYERGKALSEDLRRNIIQDVVEKGGDLVTGYFPGSFSEIALKNRTTYNTFGNNFLKLVSRVMKASPLDQNISNRMISISYDF